VFIGFCVADEYWKALDFSDTLAVRTHFYDIDFVFVSNFKWVINASASAFGISWGSFFWAKSASSSLRILSTLSNVLHRHKCFVLATMTKEKKASYGIFKHGVELSFQPLSCFQFQITLSTYGAQIVVRKLPLFQITATIAAQPFINKFC
jgi:hypothetical protein